MKWVFILGLCAIASSALAQDSAEINEKTNSAVAIVGDVEVTLEYRARLKDLDNADAVVELRVGGKLVKTATIDKKNPGRHGATARIAELDGSNDTPEIVLTRSSAGPDCCTRVEVWEKDMKGRWKTIFIEVATIGNHSVEDVDGDGRFEILSHDSEFSFKFGPRARGPYKILALDKGKIKNVTREAPYLQKNRTFYQELVSEHDEMLKSNPAMAKSMDNDNFLIVQLATRIVLGEGPQAWHAYEEAVRQGQVTEANLRSVQQFLKDHGYDF